MPTEEALRRRITLTPGNARATSNLSLILLRKGTTPLSRQEALALARKAVSIEPTSAFAHATLSQAATDHHERMDALRKSLDLAFEKNDEFISEKQNSYAVSKAVALVRLLMEPREERRRRWKAHKKTKTSSATTKSNPMRAELDEEETKLYENILKATIVGWARLFNGRNVEECMSSGEMQSILKKPGYDQLIRAEFRLGMLFRKMNPSQRHLPSCYRHLKTVVQRTSDDHELGKRAAFWIATLGDQYSSPEMSSKVFDRCPPEYVQSLYSTFSLNFDDLLVNKLQYHTPTKLRLAIDKVLEDRGLGCNSDSDRRYLRCLDLGCGTGLSGLAFRDYIGDANIVMEGIDLSPEMVEKARERGCYDVLSVGELADALCPSSSATSSFQKFDLIVACDVFVYLGDLDSVFAGIRRSLVSPSGLTAFSTEYLEETHTMSIGTHKGYQLQQTGRFSHTTKYIKALANKHGFNVCSLDICCIRKNEWKDVKGILAVFDI